MKLLLLLLIAPPVVVSLASYFIFWYEARSGPHLAELGRLSGGRVFLWGLRAVITSSISHGMVAGLYGAHLLRRFWLPQKPGKGTPPVLLVHGLFHNASAWAIFSRRLARAGFSDLHLVSYNSFTVSYWDIVDLVEKRVAEIVSQRGVGTRVALVGHSLGGLAIRGWLSSGGHKDKALAAVIIGAPNKGSKLAGLGVSRLAGSLMHQGALIREIEDREQEPPCPALSIYSPMDNMIMPSENTRIHAPGWTEEHTPPLGHVAMLYSRRVTAMTASFIQDAAGDTGASSAKR